MVRVMVGDRSYRIPALRLPGRDGRAIVGV